MTTVDWHPTITGERGGHGRLWDLGPYKGPFWFYDDDLGLRGAEGRRYRGLKDT